MGLGEVGTAGEERSPLSGGLEQVRWNGLASKKRLTGSLLADDLWAEGLKGGRVDVDDIVEGSLGKGVGDGVGHGVGIGRMG